MFKRSIISSSHVVTPAPFFSLVVPLFNEEESLPDLWEEIQRTMSSLGTFEILFINDGSTDHSKEILDDLQSSWPQIIRVLHLSHRHGQTAALKEGLHESKGEIVITLDADLQNDPADIPKMFEKLEEGYDCVCGWRKSRQDTLLKAGLSQSGNILQRWLTGLKIHDVSCTLRIYKRRCVRQILLNWEGQHRFIPLSLSLQGYKIGELVSHHRQRQYGTTKYSHKRIFKVMADFFKILLVRERT